MHIGSSPSSHAPAWPLIVKQAPIAPSGDGSLAALIATIGARVANPEPAQKNALPQHLWVEDAPTANEAAHRWLEGMVDVLKDHGAYNIAIDNYRAVYPGATRRDAEKLFSVDLVRALVDPIPKRLSASADINNYPPGRFNAADGFRWQRVMHVLKDSGAYTAGIAHYQVYRVQRMAQACKDWTAFFKSRGMDDASIERFLPERPQLMSWEKANFTFHGQLMRVGDPRHLARHLNNIEHTAPQLGHHYA